MKDVPVADAGTLSDNCAEAGNIVTLIGSVGTATGGVWSHNGGGSFAGGAATAAWSGSGEDYTIGGSDLTGTFPKMITFTLTPTAVAPCTSTPSMVVINLNKMPDIVTMPAAVCLGNSIDLATRVTDNNATTGTLAYYPTLVDAQAESNALASSTVRDRKSVV